MLIAVNKINLCSEYGTEVHNAVEAGDAATSPRAFLVGKFGQK